MKKNNWWTALKGIIIGGTMLVPGVSGGSMAMILGIYNRLIGAISSFRKNKKENFSFLLIFVLGAVAGILIFAKPLDVLIGRFPKPMLFLFMGAVLGGVPMIYKESGTEKASWKEVLCVLIGVILVITCSVIPQDFFNPDTDNGVIRVLVLLLAGFIGAIALVLPGISVSYMFLIMGLYEEILRAISEFDVVFVLPLIAGLFIGIILTTKSLEWVMKKYPRIVYPMILGFVLGSLKETFPGMPMGWEWPACIATLTVGIVGVYMLSKIKKADA